MTRGSGPPSFLVALMTVVLLFALTGYQVTSETAATRFLGRLGAALIEIDRWLPAHREDIELLARDRPDAAVRVTGLPLNLTLPASQVLEAEDEEELRGLLVRVMGRALYHQGSGAIRDERGDTTLAFNEPLRWSIAMLGNSMHNFWKAALPIAFLVLLIPIAGVLLAGRSPLGPVAFGSGIAAMLSLGTWLVAHGLSGGFTGAVDIETMMVIRDSAWLGLRNSLSICVAATALLVLITALTRERRDERSWPAVPELPPE
jgi:hypothetical protein